MYQYSAKYARIFVNVIDFYKNSKNSLSQELCMSQITHAIQIQNLYLTVSSFHCNEILEGISIT
jgi:hypothetical protein